MKYFLIVRLHYTDTYSNPRHYGFNCLLCQLEMVHVLSFTAFQSYGFTVFGGWYYKRMPDKCRWVFQRVKSMSLPQQFISTVNVKSQFRRWYDIHALMLEVRVRRSAWWDGYTACLKNTSSHRPAIHVCLFTKMERQLLHSLEHYVVAL